MKRKGVLARTVNAASGEPILLFAGITESDAIQNARNWATGAMYGGPFAIEVQRDRELRWERLDEREIPGT